MRLSTLVCAICGDAPRHEHRVGVPQTRRTHEDAEARPDRHGLALSVREDDDRAVGPEPSDCEILDAPDRYREGHIAVVVRRWDSGAQHAEGGVGRSGVVPAEAADVADDRCVPVGEPGPEQRGHLLINERENGPLKLVEPLAAEATSDLAPPR